MSISNLFEENDYDLFCRSINVKNQSNTGSFGIATPNQTIPPTANTFCTWTNVIWDDAVMFTQTSPTEIQINVPGYYLITAYIPFDANGSAGERLIFINVNGITTYNAARVTTASTTKSERLNLSIVKQIAAGDKIGCVAYQDTSLNCVLGSPTNVPSSSMFLSITRLW